MRERKLMLRSDAVILRASEAGASPANALTDAVPAVRRKLLMITFYYPPSNTSSGGLRPLKFGKFLPEFGWDCAVLTARPEAHDQIDPLSVQQIPPAVEVHRAFCVDTKKALAIRGRYPGFLAVPDRYVSWLLFGVREALRLVRREGIDALYSTSPIPTAHLIALVVKAITKLPWVADFRDPWVETEGSEVHGPLRQSVELALERRVIRSADQVVVTTREFGDWLCIRYGEAIRGKIAAVYNGYDEDDFRSAPVRGATGDCFTLVHAGLLDPHYRNPAPILQAVRQCLDAGRLPPTMRLDLAGGGELPFSGEFQQLVMDLKLQNTVRALHRVPYQEALAMQFGASALLLLQGGDDTKTLIPAKAFEYLRSGRLIVTATPADSATARLMREFEGSFVAEPGDVDGIARQLAATYDLWCSGCRSVNRTDGGLAAYSRRSGTAKLAQVLNRMIDSATAADERVYVQS